MRDPKEMRRLADADASFSLLHASPFGVDNVVAIVTPAEPKVLRAALKRIDGKRDAMVASGLVRDELDQAKGQAAMAQVELYKGH